MHHNLRKILESIKSFVDGRAVYLLTINEKGNNISIFAGDNDLRPSQFFDLNKEIQKIIEKSKIFRDNLCLSDEAFRDLQKKNSFKGIFVREILRDDNSSFLLIIIHEAPLNKTHIQGVDVFINCLKNEINYSFRFQKEPSHSIVEIFNKINIAIAVTTRDGAFVNINEFANNILEIERYSSKGIDEITIYKSYKNKRISRTLEAEESLLSFIKSKKTIFNANIKIRVMSGEKKWINLFVFPIKGVDAEICEYFIVFREINRESAIKGKLKETIENFDLIIYSYDYVHSELYFSSDALSRILGFTEEEILERPLRALRKIASEDFINYKAFIRHLRKGVSAWVEFKINDRWNNEHYFRQTGYPVFEENEIIRIDGYAQDITNEKKAFIDLAESEFRYRKLIDNSKDLVFSLDSYGYIRTINLFGAMALGYKPEQMIGKHFLEFIAEASKPEVALAFQNILRSTSIINFETIFIDSTAKENPFEVQGHSIIEKGEVKGMIAAGKSLAIKNADKELIRELEAKIVEANRLIDIERSRFSNEASVLEELNELKNEFISKISHELRTPLASIIGFAETISVDSDLPRNMIKEFSEIILNEGKRLAKMINEVLDAVKPDQGEIELFKSDFDAMNLIERLVFLNKDAAEAKGIIISGEIPAERIIINADQDKIGKTINYLIENAIRHTEKGGRVSLIVKNYIKELEIIVSDTGVGIEENKLHTIFKKRRVSESNIENNYEVSFDLYNAKQIINLHKGLLTVSSKINKGTSFILKLPK